MQGKPDAACFALCTAAHNAESEDNISAAVMFCRPPAAAAEQEAAEQARREQEETAAREAETAKTAAEKAVADKAAAEKSAAEKAAAQRAAAQRAAAEEARQQEAKRVAAENARREAAAVRVQARARGTGSRKQLPALKAAHDARAAPAERTNEYYMARAKELREQRAANEADAAAAAPAAAPAENSITAFGSTIHSHEDDDLSIGSIDFDDDELELEE